ncbi:uncharacterized protein [Dysidea avara]|uniref:uncharacterized protein n=1 Tax=Dysidea avara TaxID=196820 RepID=UPI003331E951
MHKIAWLVVFASIAMHHAIVIVQNTDNDMDPLCSTAIPCTNLQPALPEMRSGSTLVISAGTNYTLSYDDAMTMYGMESVSIVGDGSANTIITCDSDAGLAFINVHNITIANLTLVGCGAWRNSTTQNGTSNHTFMFQCGIYFLDCSDVTMYDIILRDGPGTGVMMYDTIGMVTITNSHFLRNRVPPENVEKIPGGGGFYIEFSYCEPNTTDFENCEPKPGLQVNSYYLFNNCVFAKNNGTTVRQDVTNFISPLRGSHQQFGRGGGISVHFKGYATNNSIVIVDSVMVNNGGLWGAGLLVDVLDYSVNNSVIVKRVNFTSNLCPLNSGTGGGAIRIHFFPQALSPGNVLNITDSIFDSNSAYYGGGISLSTNREGGVLFATNGITLEGCLWQNNIARAGSAIDLSSYHDVPEGQLVTPIIRNCTFYRNTNSYTNNVVQSLGLGTLHSDGIPFVFYGDNYFQENDGTALAATDVIVDIKENASAVFYRNMGLRGGAIALLGSTVLRVFPNTKLLFEENSATDRGGAIYSISVGLRDIVNSRKCFIRYHDYTLGPPNWKTNFTFINNISPNPGHAIYCTTLIPCSWGKSSIVTTPEVLSQTFRWNNSFFYNNDHNDTIATDPANTDLTSNTLSFAPGASHDLNFSITDDVGIPRKTVLFTHVNTRDNETAVVPDISTYISDNYVEVHGFLNQQFQMNFQTITTRILSFSLNATLATCPPGFYLPRTDDPSNSTCTCSVYDDDQKYNVIPYCDEANSQAFLKPHFWAGYIKDGTVLVTARCPVEYCYVAPIGRIPLPSQASNEKLDELFCSPKNREGVLCGRCKAGHYVYANSKDLACGRCTVNSGITIYIFAKIIPLLVFLLTIVLLDINLASGQLNTFVFFSQMLPSLNLYAGGQITIADGAKPFVDLYQFCYGVFNLQYFESLDSFPGVCTFKYKSALTPVTLEYIVAVTPIAIMFLVWLIMYTSDYCVFMGKRNVVGRMGQQLRKLYRKVKPNKSISLSESFFRGIVTFLVLSYSKFTLVTLTILTPAYLSGPGGKNYGVVANLDGTEDYFGQGHLPYAIPALFVLIFVVLLPLAVMAMYPRLCNMLGLHVHRIMPFFDALHVAFKHNCYYFALLYFVYRLILEAIFTFAYEVQQQYVLQQTILIIILMVHVMKRPYKKNINNIVDICLLALMPALISISFFQLFNVTTFNGINQFAMAVQIILLYLPLIYITVITVRKFYWWRRRYSESITSSTTTSSTDGYNNIPARVLESMSYSEYDDSESYRVYSEQHQDKEF